MTKTKTPKRRKPIVSRRGATRPERAVTGHLENIYSVLAAWQDYGERAGVSSGNAISSLLGYIDWGLVPRDAIVNVFSAVLSGLPEAAIAELSKRADGEREILIECGGGNALVSDYDARLIRVLKQLRLRPKAFRAASRMIKVMAEDSAAAKGGRK
jgi:hypothetical protein